MFDVDGMNISISVGDTGAVNFRATGYEFVREDTERILSNNLFNKPRLTTNVEIASGASIYAQTFDVSSSVSIAIRGYDANGNDYLLGYAGSSKSSFSAPGNLVKIGITATALNNLGDGKLMISLTDFTEYDDYESIVTRHKDKAIFTVKTGSGVVMMERVYDLDEDGSFLVCFHNADTELFGAGSYMWDVRYVLNPYYDENGRIVDGDQVITPYGPQNLVLQGVVGTV